MIRLDKSNEIKINNLISLKVVEEVSKILNNPHKIVRKLSIYIETQIHPMDFKEYFNDINGVYPLKLSQQYFDNKNSVENFINKWVDNNIDNINSFSEDYKWVSI